MSAGEEGYEFREQQLKWENVHRTALLCSVSEYGKDVMSDSFAA